MPIRPELRHHYGKEWKRRIRPGILARAKVEHLDGDGRFAPAARCECTGQCGAHVGERCIEVDGTSARTFNGAGRARRERRDTDLHPARVVVTVAHLDQDPANMAESNLLAVCQQCHNRIDAPFRSVNAIRTKYRRRRAARSAGGQTELFPSA